ncbi:hypothetical protein KY285_023884 [Solanum tuberosum]|nr:hypothetical protein KY289_024217 [Solanum tuberosum]KAH0676083.1 hypothetical protein KY285_023884 [Solanum tuberosum]
MASLKSSDLRSSNSPDVFSLSSDSSDESLASPPASSKRKLFAAEKKGLKKAKLSSSGTVSPEDMHRFWGVEQKQRYERFKSHPIVLGRVVNLSELRDSNCPISPFLRAQKLSLLFTLCGLEVFEEVVRLFYANLCVSSDSGELETLVLVTLEGAKTAVAEPDAQLSEFGPLSLCFESRILAHCIATTLLPRKGSLSNISNRDVWVKKDSFQERAEAAKPTKTSAESAALLLQDSDELKTCIMAVERGLETLYDVVEKVFQLQKDTNSDIGKLRIAMTGIKQKGIATVNKLIKQVDSLKCGVDFSNNELAISVRTSYSSLSRNVERSYNSFSDRVINTLK